jgi:hypothetical protein
MFAASGVVLIGLVGVVLFGVATFVGRRRPALLFVFGAITLLFACLGLWGWLRGYV